MCDDDFCYLSNRVKKMHGFNFRDVPRGNTGLRNLLLERQGLTVVSLKNGLWDPTTQPPEIPAPLLWKLRKPTPKQLSYIDQLHDLHQILNEAGFFTPEESNALGAWLKVLKGLQMAWPYAWETLEPRTRSTEDKINAMTKSDRGA